MLTTGAWAEGTLQEQINSATAGTTVTLTEDVTVDQTILINKNITINGGGHTITSNVVNRLGTFYVNTGTCTFTIENAIIDGRNTASMAVVAYRGKANAGLTTVDTSDRDNNNSGNIINLIGCTVKNFTGYPDSYAGAVYAFSTSTFNLTNCTFTGNTTSLSTDGASGADVWAGAAATVNISGGSYGEVFVNSNAGDHASITVSNGATVKELAVCVTEKGGGATNQPTITIDNAAVTDIATETGNALPSSAVTTQNGGTVTNMPGSYVAKIGDKKYESLAAAVAAATADQTVLLLADITVAQTILIDKNITINGDGHIITSSVRNNLGAFYINTPSSDFTITNAVLDGNGTGAMAVCAYRGEAKGDLTGTVSVVNNNSGNHITLTDCTVKNFTGYPNSYVGAVYAFSTSKFNLNNCTFTGNTTSKSTNGASGADVWAGAAATVKISGGSFGEVFVNSNAGDEARITVSNSATIVKLAVCASYRDNGTTNIPTVVIDNSTVTTLNTEEGNPIPSNDIQIQNGGSITNMPSTEVAKILNGKSTKAFATLDDAITTANGAGEDVTITLLAAATATVEPSTNVTIDAASYALTLPTFNVADGNALAYAKVTNATDNTYTVTTATYNRNGAAGTQWGTVCLPFSITTAPTGYTLYTPSSVDADKLTVEEVTYPVAAGTPVIFYKESTAEATITSANASVKIDATPVVQSGTITLSGTFSQQTITSGLESIYYINGDKFHQAKASLTVPAYRAYINYTAPSAAKPSVLSLFVDDSETTGVASAVADKATVESLCDINGRMLAAPQKGINILKLSNGKTVKLIIK